MKIYDETFKSIVIYLSYVSYEYKYACLQHTTPHHSHMVSFLFHVVVWLRWMWN